MTSSKSKTILGLILLATVICYWPSLLNGFTNWDDPKYILNNPLIKNFSLEGIKRMFTTFIILNHHYHPLTLIGWAGEYHFFKLNPLIYHFNNLVFHLANTVLLYVFVQKLTRKSIIALITTALFAIHPMHVESVAWIVERKDVQFSLFYLLALISYVDYFNCKTRKYLLLALFWFLLSCLSKPMAITLPIVLILLDVYWKRKINFKVVFEKLPFLFLALAFGVIAMAQKPVGDVTPAIQFSFSQKIFLSSFAYLAYFWKMILPVKLTCFYAFPKLINGHLPFIYYLSLIFAGGIFFFIYRLGKRLSLARFGLLFFLSTIFLVVGLVKIGDALMAERYTYIPYIGLFLIVGEIVDNCLIKYKNKRKVIVACIVVSLIVLGGISFQRTKVWKDSYTLWTDVIQKYPSAAVAYNNRGNFYGRNKKFDLALKDFNQALEKNPRYPQAYNNRALVHVQNEDYKSALKDLNRALALKQNYLFAYFHRGYVHEEIGRDDLALLDYNKVLSLDANFTAAQNRKNIVLKRLSY